LRILIPWARGLLDKGCFEPLSLWGVVFWRFLFKGVRIGLFYGVENRKG
jgi:hypothetical protein